MEDSNHVTQKGLAIKMKDGCVISCGTRIYHCTSMRIYLKYPSKSYGELVHKSDIYGFHFVNLAGNLKDIKDHGRRQILFDHG